MAGLQQPRTLIAQEPGVDEYVRALQVERLRADETEKTYEELKKIHEECIEEFRIVQNQNQKFLAESEEKLKKSDDSIRELRRITLEQTKEIAQLRNDVNTPQKQETLKLTIQAEVEKSVQSKIRVLTDENVALKAKNSTLTHELGSLRGDMESRENDFKRAKSDLTTRYERKLDDLKREKESISLPSQQVDLQRLRQLQRDNDKMSLRVKALEIELENVRSTESRNEEERDRDTKAQIRRLAEKDLLVENLKAENDVQRSLTESLRKQLNDTMSEMKQLSQKVLALEEEKISVTNEMESLRHRHQIELGKEKVRLTAEITAIQKDKNKLETQVEDLKANLTSVKQSLDLQRKLVTDKEHETQLKINALLQQHAVDSSKLEEKRHSVETQLMAAERKLTEMEAVFQNKMEAIIEEQKMTLVGKSNLQKELDADRLKMAHYQKMEMDFAHLQAQHSQMHQETQLLLKDIEQTESTLKALQLEKVALKREIDELQQRHAVTEERLTQVGIQYADEKFELQEAWTKKLHESESETRAQAEKVEVLNHDLLVKQDKLDRLNRKYGLQKKKSGTITKELATALKTKSAMLELAKDLVTPDAYQKSQNEVAQLKQSLSRLRGIILPARSPDTPNPGAVSSAVRPQYFRTVLEKAQPAQQDFPITGEDFESIIKRLKPLGFDGNNIDSPLSEGTPGSKRTSASSSPSRDSSGS